MSARPKSVGFVAGIAALQGILAIAFADRPGVAPSWATDGLGRYTFLALAALSIVLGVALLLRDDAARIVLLWLEALVFLSAPVTVAFLIRAGRFPGSLELARVLWCFFLGTAVLWTLSGPNAMAFFGAGHKEPAHGAGHDRAHARH